MVSSRRSVWCLLLPWILATRPVAGVRMKPPEDSVKHSEQEDAAILSVAKSSAEHVNGSANPQIILTLANYNYRSVVVNWMVGLHRLQVGNYAVLCMDEGLEQFMASVGRPCARVNVSMGHGILGTRLHVLSFLLGQGFDVVLSDADAIWKRNPWGFFDHGDIVASRGEHPRDTGSRLGATLCMGFIFFRATKSVTEFVDTAFMARMEGDDQIAMNYALEDWGIAYPHHLYYKNTSAIDEGNTSTGNLKIVLLDHLHFPRACAWIKKEISPYVVHCMAPKNGGSKEAQLKLFKSWYARDDWEEVPPNGNFDAWMSAVTAVGPATD